MAHVAADFAVPKKTSVLDVQLCLVENRCMLNTRRKGLDFMKDTLNMPPHERIKLLRKGEQVLCKKSGKESCGRSAIMRKPILFPAITAKVS